MRDKIRNTKKNINRGTSKLELEIVNKWYQFLLCEFGKEFDARTNASFGKVGQTQHTQAGGGQAKQTDKSDINDINNELELVE